MDGLADLWGWQGSDFHSSCYKTMKGRGTRGRMANGKSLFRPQSEGFCDTLWMGEILMSGFNTTFSGL